MAEDQENELVPEEEITAIPGWAPTVSLELQDIRTGEEEEEEIYSQRSKLYRFKDGDWKERGLGDSKLLRHKVSGKVRYMLRQEKTGKIVANHFVFEHEVYCNLLNQNESDKILCWSALDYSEEEQQFEKFALKFKDKELAEQFRSAFEGAKANALQGGSQADGPNKPSEKKAESAKAEPAAEAAAEDNDLMPEEEVTVVPGWAPTVTLEPQDVTTGEEDEDEIYSQRSKLYRFMDSEWKERGLGDSKLLRHRVTGKIRYMMRQEKTGKIVANHYVVEYPPYCELATNAGNDKIWTWTALDCAEDEQKVEQFSLRFKDAELAKQFKLAFNSAKEKMTQVREPEAKTGETDGVEARGGVGVSPKSDGQENGNPFAGVSLFASSPSQSSGTAMTGSTTSGGLFSSLTSTGAASTGGLFSIAPGTAGATSSGSLFGSSTTGSSGLFGGGGGGLFAAANTGGGLFSSVSFGANKADSPQAAESKPSVPEVTGPFANLSFASSTGGLFSNASSSLFSGGGLFGNSGSSSSSGNGLFSGSSGSGASLFAGLPESSGGGIFGSNSTTTASTGSTLFSTPASSGGLFSAASGGLLGSATAAAPSPGLWAGAGAGATANGAQDDEQYDLEEEVTQIPGWAPSVSLEVKEYVETGEEEEEEMYSQRSKLLRFVDGEWKERGTGDSKILRHIESGKCRFLMRQDKTSKIVANHYIIDQKPYCELAHNANNAKIWVWTALDWADEEQKVEKFALRFKTEELAAEFEAAFNAAKSGEMTADVGDGHDDDDWEKAEAAYGSVDGGGNLAALAASQATSGWRCSTCRLQWGEQVFECSVCDVPRPGYEDKVAASKADKDAAKQSAMAAFLGPQSGGGGGGFGQSSSSTATTATFGFGVSATTSTPAASSSPSIFGANASPSSSSIFSGASASSLFGASSGATQTGGASASSLFGASSGATQTGAAAPTQSTFSGFSATASPAPSSATTFNQQSTLPPPPPAAPSVGPDCAGCGQGIYSGYPCGQHFPLAHMQSCMAQMAGMMGGPGMCGFAPAPASSESSKVEALERSVKEMEDRLKDMRTALDAERLERSQVEFRLKSLLQDEESRRRDLEARVATAEAQTRQAEGMVEGLRRSLERQQPADDSRLVNKLEDQFTALRRSLEQALEGREADAMAAMKQKVQELEARLSSMGVEPIVTIRSPPGRMAYFQAPQRGRLSNGFNGCEDEPRQGDIQLIDPKPLFRRIP